MLLAGLSTFLAKNSLTAFVLSQYKRKIPVPGSCLMHGGARTIPRPPSAGRYRLREVLPFWGAVADDSNRVNKARSIFTTALP